MPRWLVLLLVGIAVGVGGVVFVQERYMPPRLSATESASLQASFEKADSDRQRLTRELADTSKRLDTALGDTKRLTAAAATSRETTDRLRELASSLVASLPPDPRGGAIEVRAARFSIDGGALAYDVVLTRERAGSKPFTGVMQLAVIGSSAKGPETSAALKPVRRAGDAGVADGLGIGVHTWADIAGRDDRARGRHDCTAIRATTPRWQWPHNACVGTALVHPRSG